MLNNKEILKLTLDHAIKHSTLLIEYYQMEINKFLGINIIKTIIYLKIIYRNGLIGQGVDFISRNKISFHFKISILT